MISVVIPARNEQETIGSALAALVTQATSEPYEVIVVNNGSLDQTREIAESFRDCLQLSIVDEPMRGRGAARAAGFKLAQGSIILSTDADTIVPLDWISSMIRRFDEPHIVAVTGTCQIGDCRQRTNAAFNFLQPRFMIAYRLVFRHFWLTGNNFAIRKDAYDHVGGFSCNAVDLEDIDLGFRLRRVGRIRFMRNSTVITSGRRYQDGLVRGLAGYVQAFICQFMLHTNFDRDRVRD